MQPNHKQRRQFIKQWEQIVVIAINHTYSLLKQRDNEKREDAKKAYIDEDIAKNMEIIRSEQVAHLDKANDANNKFGEQLITLSSALLAVITGFVFDQTDRLDLNSPEKTIVAVMICLFFLSVILGLINYGIISKFWYNQAMNRRKESAAFTDTLTPTIEELERKKKQIGNMRALSQTPSDTFAIRLQMWCFGVAAFLLMVMALIRVYR